MEKQDVPNARDEIRKLQEALKEKDEDPGSTDGFMVKKTRAGRKGLQKANGIKPSGKHDEQTTEKVAVQRPTQANTKENEGRKELASGFSRAGGHLRPPAFRSLPLPTWVQ